MMFGSTSDLKKIWPGIEAFTAEHQGAHEVKAHFASADNTKEKLQRLGWELWGLPRPDTGPIVITSGAGMANVLSGVAKGYSQPQDVVIGIPITDSKTDGLSSILSTVEKPPRNAILATPLNGTYAAANIAVRFFEQKYDRVVVLDASARAIPDPVEKELGSQGISYTVSKIDEIQPDDLVISPFNLNPISSNGPAADLENITKVDEILAGGKGIQIGVKDEEPVRNEWRRYLDFFKAPLKATGYTTMGFYINAVLMAAKLMRHTDAINAIEAKRGERAKSVEEHPGLLAIYEDGKVNVYKAAQLVEVE